MLIIDDVRDNPKHFGLFHALTNLVFEFDLEEWRQSGYWSEKYKPHALIEDGTMLSNVSTFKMHLLIEGRELNARQVGTVMTHPDHRGQGYASHLMNHVVKRYEPDSDLFFLFTGPDLIPFYEQFRFRVEKETRFLADFQTISASDIRMRRLDLANVADRDWLYERVDSRAPVSRRFGILDGPEIFMYHVLYRYPDCVYHDEVQDCVLVAKQMDDTLHVYDIISAKPVDVRKLLSSYAGCGIKTVDFHFIPDQLTLPTRMVPIDPEDVFMVRSSGQLFEGEFRHPTMLEA